MAVPHKHAEVSKAWADGARVQRSLGNDVWVPCPHPKWDEVHLYRVEPPREFPKSSLTGKQAWQLYLNIGFALRDQQPVPGETRTDQCMKAFTDAVIKQYILDQEAAASAEAESK